MIHNIQIAGADIQIHVADDNRLVIDIGTESIAPNLIHANGCPRLRVWINEGRMETQDDGSLIEFP